MRIIIINSKSDFSPEQLSTLSTYGEVVFVESNPSYSDSIFTDEEEKVVAVGPEVVDWKFDNESVKSIRNLRAICLPTTSYSWVDGAHLRSLGIPLTNVPKYSTESVAEYAIWMMLSLAKKLPLVIKNEWKLSYDQHLGIEVRGKVVGIVGLGSIGTRIAEMTQALGMKVQYWSRSATDDRFEYLGLNELMSQSDFVFPTLAKNTETSHMLSAEKLGDMKAGSYIVSITGDELFDLPYAVEAIKSERLAGLAFESEEKKITDYEGNILVTPPIAWYTKQALSEDMRIWIESVISCVKENPVNIVN